MTSKLTVVTPPDIHLVPGLRILLIGDYRFTTDVQDLIGAYWLNEDVVLYKVDAKADDDLEWCFVHGKLADIIVVDVLHMWDCAWPILAGSNADIFFKAFDDGTNYQKTIKTLKLTYGDRVFHTKEDAVMAAIGTRHK